MPQLTQDEKAAGRAFRDHQQALLDELNAAAPSDLTPPPFVHHYRHGCPARGGQSVSFELSEVYQPSPDGRVAFIYREGRCGGCKILGRTRAWVADALERPPLGRT